MGFGIVCAKQVLEYFTEQLRVKRYLLLLGRIFLNGEVVSLKYREKALFGFKEQHVRNNGTIAVSPIGKFVIIATESVIVKGFFYSIQGLGLVKTFEQTTIDKWYGGKYVYHFLFRHRKQFSIAILVLHILTCRVRELAGTAILVNNGAIKSCKEQVL